jgi:hypothetical protein
VANRGLRDNHNQRLCITAATVPMEAASRLRNLTLYGAINARVESLAGNDIGINAKGGPSATGVFRANRRVCGPKKCLKAASLRHAFHSGCVPPPQCVWGTLWVTTCISGPMAAGLRAP